MKISKGSSVWRLMNVAVFFPLFSIPVVTACGDKDGVGSTAATGGRSAAATENGGTGAAAGRDGDTRGGEAGDESSSGGASDGGSHTGGTSQDDTSSGGASEEESSGGASAGEPSSAGAGGEEVTGGAAGNGQSGGGGSASSSGAGGEGPVGGEAGSSAVGGASEGGSAGNGGIVGDAGAGSPNGGTADTAGTAGTAGTAEALDCSTPPPALNAFETIQGFTSAEDFAFDDQGNLVSVDSRGNLIRQAHDGTSEIWVPNLTSSAAGTAFLPNGSLIVSDSVSSLLRIEPNGAVTTLLSGLEYPNGVDVDLDGVVYVSEMNAGRIRRVDPETGDFEIIATGLYAPNGIAFSPDYQTLYCGSFGAGIVYAISRTGATTWGPAVQFARTPGARGDDAWEACDGLEEGASCELPYMSGGSCTATSAGLLCQRPGPCAGLAEGDTCTATSGSPGLCASDGLGGMMCEVVNTCGELFEGDPCELPDGGTGTCTPAQDWSGNLYCAPEPCANAVIGDACVTASSTGYYGEVVPGLCTEDEESNLYCREILPCDNRIAGDACTTSPHSAYPDGLPGFCTEDEASNLTCRATQPCDNRIAGDACTTLPSWDYPEGAPGFCQDEGETDLYCRATEPCDNLVEGDACEARAWIWDDETGTDAAIAVPGVCTADYYYESGIYCRVLEPCEGRLEGDACVDIYDQTPGVCHDWDGWLSCDPAQPCDGLAEGDPCEQASGGEAGVCEADEWGELICAGPNPCVTASQGDSCTDGYGSAGSCEFSTGGELDCVAFSADRGGLDGIGVDACGYVYLAEYRTGKVYRVTPDGSAAVELITLPSGWIPNVSFGSGLGGWDSNTLYIADRDSGRVFGLDIGLPGRPTPFPRTSTTP